MTPEEKISELQDRLEKQSSDNWPLKILMSEATVAYKQAQSYFDMGKMNIYPIFAKRYEQIEAAINLLLNHQP
jgi:hypothetical protein